MTRDFTRVFLRPFHKFQRGPGGTIFDLSDTRFSIRSSLREERNSFSGRETFKGTAEQDAIIFALSIDRDIP